MIRLDKILALSLALVMSTSLVAKAQNLFRINSLGEVQAEPAAKLIIELRPVNVSGQHYLRASCAATTWTPSVYLKKLAVTPGDVYTVFIEAVASQGLSANMVVAAGAVNVVWPGPELVTGVSRVTYTIPEGVHETQIGFSFVYPEQEDFVLIKNVGIYKGTVADSEWVSNENEGLQPLLVFSNQYLLWLLFPFAILILIGLYFYDSRRGAIKA